jgi:hypothetical protein
MLALRHNRKQNIRDLLQNPDKPMLADVEAEAIWHLRSDH